MWDCATSKTDHTECCEKRFRYIKNFVKKKFIFSNVLKECLNYCQHKNVPVDYFQHLFCLQAFNPIRDCFREYLDKNPNIFGDE